MKNTFKLAFVALVLAASFSACGGGAGDKKVDSTATTVDTTKAAVDTTKKDTTATDTTKKDTTKK